MRIKFYFQDLGFRFSVSFASNRPLFGTENIKRSPLGRVDLDIAKALQTIHHINPSALMFGTDLPSTRTRPFAKSDIELIKDSLDPVAHPKVFYQNAMEFYRLK